MDAQARPTKTTLPGIGIRYDLVTESGQHVSVVVHNDGRRFLGFHKPEDDDECQASVPLGVSDAAALAQLLLPERIDPVRSEIEIDLVTEHVPVSARSPY
ncbi:MAG TPA: potassium transporter TrkA, partial [Kribbella sp.]|nr:potassium transporter TrkA [Kribbella sp.]